MYESFGSTVPMPGIFAPSASFERHEIDAELPRTICAGFTAIVQLGIAERTMTCVAHVVCAPESSLTTSVYERLSVGFTVSEPEAVTVFPPENTPTMALFMVQLKRVDSPGAIVLGTTAIEQAGVAARATTGPRDAAMSAPARTKRVVRKGKRISMPKVYVLATDAFSTNGDKKYPVPPTQHRVFLKDLLRSVWRRICRDKVGFDDPARALCSKGVTGAKGQLLSAVAA